jgi:methionyl-tRNA formyltransferase
MPARRSIIFLGTPEFAVPSLRALAASDAFEIVLAVTRPDKPVGRKQELTPPPLKVAALALGIPVLQPLKVNEELPAYVAQNGLKPDFLVTVAYGHILSQAVLDLASVAPVNLHGSVLPKWRGASPVEHAILNGDAETGVSVQVMVKELDAGPVLSSLTLPLGPQDTSASVRETLAARGAELLVQTLLQPLSPVPQDASHATFCGKLSRDDGKANPATMTAQEIDRRVRALNPWPGVTAIVEGQELKILGASPEAVTGSWPLPCKDGTVLHLVTVQPAGKRAMSAKEWSNGLRNEGKGK